MQRTSLQNSKSQRIQALFMLALYIVNVMGLLPLTQCPRRTKRPAPGFPKLSHMNRLVSSEPKRVPRRNCAFREVRPMGMIRMREHPISQTHLQPSLRLDSVSPPCLLQYPVCWHPGRRLGTMQHSGVVTRENFARI